LGRFRDTLQNPRPVEEVLLQLKQDRVLGRIAEALEKYVEFHGTTHSKRTRTN
jgi:hypothetical protein